MRVAIIGAGMAGLSCGEGLIGRGHEVVVFDKGRRPGGRMSAKTLPTVLGDAGFDYGAPYMSTRDPAFRARVERWLQAGVVSGWTAAGADAFVGTPGMSAPLADMAGCVGVAWSTRITALVGRKGAWRLIKDGLDPGGFHAAVVAVPAEQVGALVGEHDRNMAALAGATPSRPCWTVMAAFAEALPVAADVVEARGAIASAIRNSAKPLRRGPEAWVIQAGPEWSVAHLEDDRDSVAASLLALFAGTLGIAIPEPLAIAAHRWRYARSGRTDRRCCWNGELALGLCGDWLIGADVEAAWLSGAALAREIAG